MPLAEKILAVLAYTLGVLFIGILLGWHLHTRKVDQGDLNKEAEIGKQYAEKRAADEKKGDGEKGKAAASSTKVIYRDCALDDEDFDNLTEAFKR